MSTDVFIVDTPWLIEKIEEEAKKEYPQNCAISCVIWQWNTMLLPLNIQATLPIFIQWNPTTMQTWICWKPKFMKLFSPNQKVYTKVKNEEPTYYSKTSHIKSSQFASGSIVEGTVERSVVSRRYTFIKVQRSAVVSSWCCGFMKMQPSNMPSWIRVSKWLLV